MSPELINKFLLPLFASFLSLGAVATIGWFQFKKQHWHTLRMNLFAELMGNRHDVRSEAFTAALNKILVLFHNDQHVVRTVRDFTAQVARGEAVNQSLVQVFRAICKNLRIDEQTITDTDFTTAFNVRQHGPARVKLSLQPALDGSEPILIVLGRKDADTIPLTETILNETEARKLIDQIDQSLRRAKGF